MSPVPGTTPAPPRRGTAVAARACAVLSFLLFCAFASVLVYIHLGHGGCWSGAYLGIAAAIVLCAPGLALLLVTALLRPSEILWLIAALVVLAFAAGLILQLSPGQICSGSG